MTLEIAAMDPLLPSPCLLCGERFEAEGYSERFKPQLLPGVPVDGFAPAILIEGRPIGFVCPACFGDGREDLARSMRRQEAQGACRKPGEGRAGVSGRKRRKLTQAELRALGATPGLMARRA